MDNFLIKVNGIHRGLQVDRGALLLELVRRSVKQSAGTADLMADPKGHAAAQKADIAVLVKNDDIFIRILIQDGVDSSGACMVGTNDDNVHRDNLFSKLEFAAGASITIAV